MEAPGVGTGWSREAKHGPPSLHFLDNGLGPCSAGYSMPMRCCVSSAAHPPTRRRRRRPSRAACASGP